MLIKKELKNKTIMAVDSSINDCGVAIYKGENPVFYDLINPEIKLGKEIDKSQKVKAVKNKKSFDYVDKSMSIYKQVKTLAEEYGPDVIIIEVPEYYGASAFLSRESGSLFKLTFVSGMLMTLPNAVALNPTTWKGQLSKEIIKNRMVLNLPKIKIKGMNHNICDALGIGYFIIHGKT
jgi:Holliday junction resolvasome RuvABC endonuclease subunit